MATVTSTPLDGQVTWGVHLWITSGPLILGLLPSSQPPFFFLAQISKYVNSHCCLFINEKSLFSLRDNFWMSFVLFSEQSLLCCGSFSILILRSCTHWEELKAQKRVQGRELCARYSLFPSITYPRLAVQQHRMMAFCPTARAPSECPHLWILCLSSALRIWVSEVRAFLRSL